MTIYKEIYMKTNREISLETEKRLSSSRNQARKRIDEAQKKLQQELSVAKQQLEKEVPTNFQSNCGENS